MKMRSRKLIADAQKRRLELEQLINDFEKKSSIIHGACPKGTIKINHNKGRTQYYLKEYGRKGKEKYLKKDQVQIAFQVAQRAYDKNVVKAARAELASINRFLKEIPAIQAEDVFDLYSEERKKLINPIIIPRDLFVKEWESVSFIQKGFSEDYPEYYTARQERVRSKSEVLIADTLGHMGIPYRYEYPVVIDGRTFHPDFTVLDIARRREVLWEHLGMMDSVEYAEKAFSKIDIYERAGFVIGDTLILTWETSRIPLSTRKIKEAINRYLTVKDN